MGRPRNIGSDIKRLRNKGYSYSQICKELKCAKSTVAYHLGDNEKTNSLNRLRKYRKNPLHRRSMEWEGFDKLKKSKNIWRAREEKNRAELIREYIKVKFNNKCYISGRELPDDFSKIELDHIIPVSKNGSNDISNMGPTLRHSNAMKSDLTMDELLDLCKDTLEYHGYSVKKK